LPYEDFHGSSDRRARGDALKTKQNQDRKIMSKPIVPFVAGAILAMFAVVAPAAAGPAENDLLQTYVGSWAGTGVLSGGDEPEDFSCRMTIKKGNGTRINFAGRCTLVNVNLSMNGTVAFNDANQQYEGIMSASTRYSGLAIGHQRGDTIVFNFQQTQADDKGNDMSVDSKITLGKDEVTVDFIVAFADSGDKMRTSVPFERQ
jgi:hypothetical protein